MDFFGEDAAENPSLHHAGTLLVEIYNVFECGFCSSTISRRFNSGGRYWTPPPFKFLVGIPIDVPLEELIS